MRAFCFGIEARHGEDLFLPTILPNEGFTLRFRVKGQHIRIAVTNRRENSRDKDASGHFHVYFLCIGAFKNSKTYLKRSNKSGDRVLTETTRDACPSAMAWPDQYREYWVTYVSQTGVLRLGHGGKEDLGDESKVLLEWCDPRPHNDLDEFHEPWKVWRVRDE